MCLEPCHGKLIELISLSISRLGHRVRSGSIHQQSSILVRLYKQGAKLDRNVSNIVVFRETKEVCTVEQISS